MSKMPMLMCAANAQMVTCSKKRKVQRCCGRVVVNSAAMECAGSELRRKKSTLSHTGEPIDRNGEEKNEQASISHTNKPIVQKNSCSVENMVM